MMSRLIKNADELNSLKGIKLVEGIDGERMIDSKVDFRESSVVGLTILSSFLYYWSLFLYQMKQIKK